MRFGGERMLSMDDQRRKATLEQMEGLLRVDPKGFGDQVERLREFIKKAKNEIEILGSFSAHSRRTLDTFTVK